MTHHSQVRSPDSQTIDLTEHEFAPPCDSIYHEKYGWPVTAADWIVVGRPTRACGCPTRSTTHLWCDHCWNHRLSRRLRCHECWAVVGPFDNIIYFERLDRRTL